MLLILGLIVVIVGFYFLALSPMYTKINVAKVENQTLTAEKSKREIEIANIERYKKKLKSTNQDYQAILGKVYNNYEIYDLDRVLTKMIADNGLTPKLLKFNNTNTVVINPLPSLSGALSANINKTNNSSSQTNTGKDSVMPSETSNVIAVTVDIGVSGPSQNINKFLNKLDSESGMFITKCNSSFPVEDSGNSSPITSPALANTQQSGLALPVAPLAPQQGALQSPEANYTATIVIILGNKSAGK